MSARLESLTIQNFRCLDGNITIPLTAPVVLIYGANGQGKTSIFSAIELALTGHITSLERFDHDYLKHVPWRGSRECAVSVALSDGRSSKAIVSNQTANLESELSQDEKRFFRERCLLPQSLLWRLLEDYQLRDNRSDSSLTAFVKDLIGLDKLDAVVDGLHVNGDVRRVRSASRLFSEAQETEARLAASIAKTEQQLRELTNERKRIKDATDLRLVRLGLSDLAGLEPKALVLKLQAASERDQLESLARSRRDLRAISDQWQSLAQTPAAIALAEIESELDYDRERLRSWEATTGLQLVALFEGLVGLFPELSYSTGAVAAQQLRRAQSLIQSELTRCVDLLGEERDLETHLQNLTTSIDIGQQRLLALDEQISQLTVDGDDLAQALAQLLPHIRSGECPVCDRDFAEASKETLLVHVSTKLTEIKERSAKLRALSADRAESLTRLRQAQFDKSAASGRRAGPDAKRQLETRIERLSNMALALSTIEQPAAVGAELLSNVVEGDRKRAEIQVKNQQLRSLLSSLDEMADALAPGFRRPGSDVSALIRKLGEDLRAREEALSTRLEFRNGIAGEAQRLAQSDGQIEVKHHDLLEMKSKRDKVAQVLKSAEAVREDGRRLLKRATDTRSALVRSALNDHLNEIWRRLFIRLAPSEPYVPAFRKTLLRGDQVMLETRDRAGTQAGTPGAMLSAGNLNTAALTLFLGLHLSVTPTLPWLLLDDPVQSMDEVHVSQFAALLRTLAKQHGRQVIIAVHERPLFDYLALELSPAFESDSLLTLELGRDADGAAAVHPREYSWSKDTAVA
jgi:exonuclease SbcC